MSKSGGLVFRADTVGPGNVPGRDDSRSGPTLYETLRGGFPLAILAFGILVMLAWWMCLAWVAFRVVWWFGS